MPRPSFRVASALALFACLAGLTPARQEPQVVQQRKCGRGDFQSIQGHTIRRVEFYGNTYTADNLIRRKLMLIEGESFDVSTLRRGLERVHRLGIFEKVKDEEIEWCLLEGMTDEVDFVVEFRYKPSKRRKTQ